MARDPNNPRDLDQLRRKLPPQVDPDMVTGGPTLAEQMAAATPPPTYGQSLARSARNELSGAVDAVGGPISYVLAGMNGADPSSSDLSGQRVAPATVTPPIPPQVNFIDPANVNATEGEVRRAATPGRSGASGLTRIVKTGDGTYVQTSDPNVKGQERIYDALGNRADVNVAAVNTPGRTFSGTTDYAQAEQNAATEMGSIEGRNRILARGRDSLARVGRMQAESTSASQKAFLDSLDPKSRAALLSDSQKQALEERKAAAQFGLQRQNQQISALNAQLGLTQQQINVDRYERERLSNPDTRDMAVREFFGSLEGLPEAERVKRLTSTPEGRRIMDAATQGIREQTGIRDLTPAQATRTNGLLRALGANPYTDDRRFVGGNFDPSASGFSDNDFETLRKAYLQQYVGR